MTANTASKFDAMGKEELRAVMREAGISYSKLNNDGMRAALVAHYAKAEPAAEEVETEEEVEARPTPNGMSFAQILGMSPVAAPVHNGNVTRVVDGKKVEAKAPKAKGEPRTRSDKPAAPVVPRVSRKGYTIQKEREERNGVKRPSEGTVCGNVWAEFDKNPEIKAGELQALSDEKGWNRTNVSCEFYAWRKFMGIKGRAAK
jgi:hypothetical protein